MKLSLIAAMSKNRVIGINNSLPWKISEDLKYFKKVTLNAPVIMGRKTFESIGRVLPKRRNIILTRQDDYSVLGGEVFSSLDLALQTLKKQCDKEIFIIGGEQVYKQALPIADRIYLTLVDHEIEGDSFFPEFSLDQFQEVKRVAGKQQDDCDFFYSFIVFDRLS